jgi:hypothetical protein
MPVGRETANTVEQTPVTISGVTTQSSTFAATTRLVRIHTDSICSISLGVNPTASVNTRRLAANQTEYFGVPVGGSYKVAVISNS